MSIIELEHILTERFEHAAQAEMFVSEAIKAIIDGKVSAICGSNQNIKIGERTINVESMVFRDSTETQRWIESTEKRIKSRRYSKRKVATAALYEGMSDAEFEYFAAQAKQDLIKQYKAQKASSKDKQTAKPQPPASTEPDPKPAQSSSEAAPITPPEADTRPPETAPHTPPQEHDAAVQAV